MKRFIIATAVLATAALSHAQGYWVLDNTANATGSQNPYSIIIDPILGRSDEGLRGQSLGSDATFATPNYDIGYLFSTDLSWVGTSSLNDTTFLAASSPGPQADFGRSFLAGTGDDADGAGFFGDGNTTITMPATSDGEHIAVQLIAWYDPTGSTTFSQAYYGGFNVGWSSIMNLRLASGADPALTEADGFLGFTVHPNIPEPSTFALAGLGAAALLIFHRRK